MDLTFETAPGGDAANILARSLCRGTVFPLDYDDGDRIVEDVRAVALRVEFRGGVPYWRVRICDRDC